MVVWGSGDNPVDKNDGKADEKGPRMNATLRERGVPEWVPEAAWRYLAHTESGQSIRELARGAGCHASTVLRQIRRIELRRDDILVELALQRLGPLERRNPRHADVTKELDAMIEQSGKDCRGPVGAVENESRLRHDAAPVLRRLAEPGTLLAVAADMEMAVVVRDSGQRDLTVPRALAEAMALKDWIICQHPGRIARYQISATGRAALMALMAQTETHGLRGMAEAQAPFMAGTPVPDADEDGGRRGQRYGAPESPLLTLARRRDKDGAPFLTDAQLRAGERLREDFELALMAAGDKVDWESVLAGAPVPQPVRRTPRGTDAARARVAAALCDLGPGLGHVALRCCCHLEGLETTERDLGWAARSGKVVLRIALIRLERHYAGLGPEAAMIG